MVPRGVCEVLSETVSQIFSSDLSTVSHQQNLCLYLTELVFDPPLPILGISFIQTVLF